MWPLRRSTKLTLATSKDQQLCMKKIFGINHLSTACHVHAFGSSKRLPRRWFSAFGTSNKSAHVIGTTLASASSLPLFFPALRQPGTAVPTCPPCRAPHRATLLFGCIRCCISKNHVQGKHKQQKTVLNNILAQVVRSLEARARLKDSTDQPNWTTVIFIGKEKINKQVSLGFLLKNPQTRYASTTKKRFLKSVHVGFKKFAVVNQMSLRFCLKQFSTVVQRSPNG